MSELDVESVRDQFYAELSALLRELKPGRDAPDPTADTHLWLEGYADSIVMLEIIYFLEERSGREMHLDGDFLPTFFTLRSIYDNYVASNPEE